MAPWGRRKSPVPRHTRQNRPEVRRPTECNPRTRGKVTNTLKKCGDLCIYRSVPPTHEYGTRPFLRWARSQGRSPHASGKAKNTFGPVGIPLFKAPQAPGNKPNSPEGGISLGGWPPEGGGNLQCRGTPGRTAQRLDGLPNATQELERKGHNHPKKERGPLYLSLRPTNARIWHKAVFKVGPVAGPKPTRVRQGQKYLRPRRHSPF